MKSALELYIEGEYHRMDRFFKWATGFLLSGFLVGFVVACYLPGIVS